MPAKVPEESVVFKTRLTDHLKHYLFIGGMPEAVSVYAENQDFEAVRLVQRRLLDAYETDFSKHAPTSLSDYREEAWMINIPLYAIGTVGALGR
jgi:hypothetical protein